MRDQSRALRIATLPAIPKAINDNITKPAVFKFVEPIGSSLGKGDDPSLVPLASPILEKSQYNIFAGLYHFAKGRLKRCKTLLRRGLMKMKERAYG